MILKATLLTVLLSVACVTPSFAKDGGGSWDPAWVYCASDSECTPVWEVCGWGAANKSYKKDAESYHVAVAPYTDCVASPEMSRKDSPPTTTCRNSHCMVVSSR